jgi:hypothetical protein
MTENRGGTAQKHQPSGIDRVTAVASAHTELSGQVTHECAEIRLDEDDASRWLGGSVAGLRIESSRMIPRSSRVVPLRCCVSSRVLGLGIRPKAAPARREPREPTSQAPTARPEPATRVTRFTAISPSADRRRRGRLRATQSRTRRAFAAAAVRLGRRAARRAAPRGTRGEASRACT